MFLQVLFVFKDHEADVTLVCLHVTNAVYSSLMHVHVFLLRKLLAANFARVLGVRMLRSWRTGCSCTTRNVHRAAVSAHR